MSRWLSVALTALLAACGGGTGPGSFADIGDDVVAAGAGGRVLRHVSGEVGPNGPIYEAGLWTAHAFTPVEEPPSNFTYGPSDATVVISEGHIYTSMGAPGYWVNEEFVPGPAGDRVLALAVSGADVYLLLASRSYLKNDGPPVMLEPPAAADFWTLSGRVAVLNGDVYAPGISYRVGASSTGGYWKNGVWVPVTGPHGVISGVAADDGHFYLCGVDDGEAAYWVDGVKVPLPGPIGFVDTSAMSVNGGHVVVLGQERDQTPGGRYPSIIYWDNGTKVPVTDFMPVSGSSFNGAEAYGIANAGARVVVAGHWMNQAAYWDQGELHILDYQEVTRAYGIAIRP
jgi:hypothetical protein